MSALRCHAMQSIIVFGLLMIVEFTLVLIPFIGTFFTWAISVLGFILWIVLMVNAYKGKTYKLPWAGNLAEQWAGSLNG